MRDSPELCIANDLQVDVSQMRLQQRCQDLTQVIGHQNTPVVVDVGGTSFALVQDNELTSPPYHRDESGGHNVANDCVHQLSSGVPSGVEDASGEIVLSDAAAAVKRLDDGQDVRDCRHERAAAEGGRDIDVAKLQR